MSHRLPQRSELPAEFTPETVRQLPIAVLGRLARPGNGVLNPEEQASFDAAVHEVMSQTARRVSSQINRSDWTTVMRDAHGTRTGERRRGRPTRADEQVRRLARQIGQQVDLAEGLAPGVDWSFAQPVETSTPRNGEPATPVDQTDDDDRDDSEDDDRDDSTVSDLEQRLTDQVELVQVMSEIADVSKRAYALEQQRDLQTTRGVFFGFVVSVAVLAAGWAPIVAAHDWAERVWVMGLTIGTCVVAGMVYALVRRWQIDHPADTGDQPE